MAMDKDINELRNEINSIDREFVELFIKRMGVSLSVAEYKKKTGMPVLDRARERELLNRVAKMSGDEMKTYTRLLYSTVLNLSRSYQHSFLDNTSVLTEKILSASANTSDVFRCRVSGRRGRIFEPCLRKAVPLSRYNVF